jgi:hypothetical protein
MKTPQMLAIIVSGMIGISPGLASATVMFPRLIHQTRSIRSRCT